MPGPGSRARRSPPVRATRPLLPALGRGLPGSRSPHHQSQPRCHAVWLAQPRPLARIAAVMARVAVCWNRRPRRTWTSILSRQVSRGVPIHGGPPHPGARIIATPVACPLWVGEIGAPTRALLRSQLVSLGAFVSAPACPGEDERSTKLLPEASRICPSSAPAVAFFARPGWATTPQERRKPRLTHPASSLGGGHSPWGVRRGRAPASRIAGRPRQRLHRLCRL